VRQVGASVARLPSDWGLLCDSATMLLSSVSSSFLRCTFQTPGLTHHWLSDTVVRLQNWSSLKFLFYFYSYTFAYDRTHMPISFFSCCFLCFIICWYSMSTFTFVSTSIATSTNTRLAFHPPGTDMHPCPRVLALLGYYVSTDLGFEPVSIDSLCRPRKKCFV